MRVFGDVLTVRDCNISSVRNKEGAKKFHGGISAINLVVQSGSFIRVVKGRLTFF